jgi:hypothetical protein
MMMSYELLKELKNSLNKQKWIIEHLIQN